ncbi:hypothetical protein SAY87_030812 [Trapa incisa]|uniref:Uncharacterized protein n=1 Tax=Trapa incisa TaxID=236973 RepID=A0AAN7KP37_9MYRT|nr:hypothetical protein SAY87_030812 [Trapa incisa]
MEECSPPIIIIPKILYMREKASPHLNHSSHTHPDPSRQIRTSQEEPLIMKAEEAIVLYPSPAIGHLISMVELGKLLSQTTPHAHNPLSVHIIVASQAYNAGSTASYISASSPSITFHHLPPTSLPPDFSTTSPHHETLAFELLRLNNPNLHSTLLSISADHCTTIRALVIDLFCYTASQVAKDLSIPLYYFCTSGAGILAFFLYLPTLHEKYSDEAYTNPNNLIHVPGIPPVPFSDIPNPIRDRADNAYTGFMKSSKSVRDSSGVIINTFEELEPRTIQAITEGKLLDEWKLG